MTKKDYAKLYLGSAWYKQRKLHMIWRAIARRHLSCLRAAPYIDLNGETDP